MLKSYRLTIFLVVALLLTAFTWYEIRPSWIKHDCSWIKEIEAGVPAKPSMTEDELQANNMLSTCDKPVEQPIQPDMTALERHRITVLNDAYDRCLENNRKIVSDYAQPRNAVPEKVSWRKSNTHEYEFCLRDKGL